MANQMTTGPTAAQVGKAFVSQYYNVLHNSPHVAHRFYTDASRMTRAEFGPNAIVDTVVAQAEIHGKLVSFHYGGCKAEIKTVDSQESLNGSVLVMVTGALSSNNTRRNFVQSFFLAPQEKGYYVLNDIHRYLDENIEQMHIVPIGGSEIAAGLPADPHEEDEERDFSPSPPPTEDEVVAEDVYETVDPTDASDREDELAAKDTDYEEIPEAAANEPATSEIVPPPVSPEDVPTEKKSYASILLVNKDNVGAAAAPSALVSSRGTEQHVSSQQTATSMPLPPALTSGDFDDSSHVDTEDRRSIYVKNLPSNITSLQLEAEFMRFGPIKPDSVNVRSQKQGLCYGFVEFEDTSSAQSAIAASPISIYGRPAYIEEKRSMASRGVRGRASQGGGLFRNDGGRGRTSYGRGFTRGPGQDRDYRGRGSGPMRGSYSGKVPNYSNNFNGNARNFDGYRRSDGEGMYVNKPLRRGAGN